MTAAEVLSVQGLRIEAVGSRALVEDVSLSVGAGEVLGIVGESGSGKSMSAFAIADLLPSGVRRSAGRIVFQGRNLDECTSVERRALAGSRIGMVFQDPLSSFNPVRSVGSMLIESACRHQRVSVRQAREVAIAALADVHLPDPSAVVDAYPHQLSGGQRQRAMIALATLNDPALLIADEPTTALDATVQLRILSLLQKAARNRATILITHDLAVASALCDRVMVMQQGRCVEQGALDEIFNAPSHPYTRQLLAASKSQPDHSVADRSSGLA